MPNANEETAKRMLNAEEKRQKAVELRKKGWTFKAIGNALGVSNVMAHNYVKKAMAQSREKTSELAQDLIDIENARLNDYRRIIDEQIENGDLSAIDKALKINKAIRELNGLDKPVKIAPTDPTGEQIYDPQAIRQRVLDLLAKQNEYQESTD